MNNNVDELDPILKAIRTFDKRPSINETVEEKEKCSFQTIELESIIMEILALDISKASFKDSIPPKIIKDNCDISFLQID